MKRYVLIFFTLILLLSISVSAAVDNVTSNSSDSFKDLNHVINSSSNFVSLNKNYTFDSDLDHDLIDGIIIDKEMTIEGNGFSINANGKASFFKIQSNNVVFRNINFLNANNPNSNPICWNGDNGFVDNCNFVNNTNSFSGILHWEGSDGIINNSNFISNSAKSFGSAVYWGGTYGKLMNSNFIKNNASNQGCIFLRGSNTCIFNCSFKDNGDYEYALNCAKIVLDYDGDCKQTNPYSNLVIRSFYFYYGGALYCEGNNIRIDKCLFKNNSAYDGGAVYYVGKNMTCVNSSFINNSCVNNGSAIYFSLDGRNSSIIDSVFINNFANGSFEIYTQNFTQTDFLKNYSNVIIVKDSRYKLLSNDIEYTSAYDLFRNNHFSICLLVKILDDNYNSFEDLLFLINNTPENGVLLLDSDYSYISGLNKGILISKPITIDGCGHILDGKALSRIFNITSDNVVLKNINFINGNAFGRYSGVAGGGAIYWSGANGLVENCRFIDNKGSGIEDDPFDDEETFITEDGGKITKIRIRPMGAKINEGGAIVWSGADGVVLNSIFTGNSVGYPNSGGAICWRGNNGKVINSEFYRNDAWCGSAIAWIGNNGAVLNSIIANSSLDGGIYWFGHKGVIKNSILLSNGWRPALSLVDADVDADYNFWGDTFENTNQISKIKNVNKWLVIKFTHNGEFVKKGEKITVNYDIFNLVNKKGHLVKYNLSRGYSGQFTYTAYKNGFLDISFVNGRIKADIDSREHIVSKDLKKYYSNKISFKVSVYDINGKVISEYVKFKINKKTYKIKTDKKGMATLKLKLKPGKYKIYIFYGKVTVKNTITVKSVLITKNLSKKVKNSAKFKVKVLNSNGKPFTKQIVKIKFKGKIFKLKTNKKGIAVFKIPKKLKVGKYTIKTSYRGLTNSNKIKVKK